MVMTLTDKLRTELEVIVDTLEQKRHKKDFHILYTTFKQDIMNRYEIEGLTEPLYHSFYEMILIKKREQLMIDKEYNCLSENFGDA